MVGKCKNHRYLHTLHRLFFKHIFFKKLIYFRRYIQMIVLGLAHYNELF